MSVAKGEKSSFFGGVKKWFRSVWSELKKVHWPTKKQVAVYTMVVIVAVVLVGAGIWIVDSGISYLMRLIIK